MSRTGPSDPDIVHAGGRRRQSVSCCPLRTYRGARDCTSPRSVARTSRAAPFRGRRARGHHREGAQHRLLRLERHRHHERARRRGRDLRHAARRAGDQTPAMVTSRNTDLDLAVLPRVEGEGRATVQWRLDRRATQGGAGDRRDRIAHMGLREHGHARDRQQLPPRGPGDADPDRCRDQSGNSGGPYWITTAAWWRWRR